MTDFKNTKTCKNLMTSFIGESQAYMNYMFFKKTAVREKLKEISDIFEITAKNEMSHANTFLKLLHEHLGNGSVSTTSEYPVSKGDTLANLKAAAAGEHHESHDLYPVFAEIARQEGFDHIAHHFEVITEIEKQHEERFNYYAKHLEDGSLFKQDKEVYFKCEHCGYITFSKEAPESCPSCHHPRTYFKIVTASWQ
ncbi:MAG: rubrerythrin [Cellulosilyticaceae bacterium]